MIDTDILVRVPWQRISRVAARLLPEIVLHRERYGKETATEDEIAEYSVVLAEKICAVTLQRAKRRLSEVRGRRPGCRICGGPHEHTHLTRNS